MNPERWQQASRILETALERKPEQLAAYLDEVCANDAELRREVESLLVASARAGSLLDSPAMAMAAPLFVTDSVSSMLGRSIGRYKIVTVLGTGGMGEVYLAHDTRLGRKIALKLLPTDFTTNKDRLRRFEQEAHAASTLSHPNVCVVHEVGESEEGHHYIAMEYVDGVTLRQHMTEARLKLDEVLDVAVQVASGIAAAHDVGVVHRDIKPENIMLRRDGYIKVLDFGLAKLTAQATTKVTTTAGARLKTDTGVVMGTSGYMSPEQARGLSVDARTDIWSLGVVLYEMVAGHAPFQGETNSDVIASLLEREPAPLASLAPGAPAELQRIVSKALRKDREERYQTAKDMLLDLKGLRRVLEIEAEPGRASPRESSVVTGALKKGVQAAVGIIGGTVRETDEVGASHPTSSAEYLVGKIRVNKRGVMLIAAVLVIAAAGTGVGLYKYLAGNRSQPQPAAPFQRMAVTRLTTNGKVASNAIISPDGKYVAYVVRSPGPTHVPQHSLWVRQVATGSDVQIIPPAEVWYSHLMFSRDGNYIYYIKWGKYYIKGGKDVVLYQMPVLGGVARKLRDVPPGVGGSDLGDLALSPDGTQLAFVRNSSVGESALMVSNALDEGGERKLATRQRPDLIRVPMWSPDGKKIACAVGRLEAGGGGESIVEVRVADGAEKLITPHRWKWVYQGAWLPDGSGLLMPFSDTNAGITAGSFQLWYISYPSGEVRRITNDLSDYYGVSLTADSTALATVQTDATFGVWVVSNGESRAKQIMFGGKDSYLGFSWTPDGKIVYETEAGGNQDIWIMDGDGSHPKQLTVDASPDFDPSVTPDGRYIVFTSMRSGNANIWRMDLDGGNPKQLTKGVRDFVPQCSRDGKWVVYTAADPVRTTLWKVPMDGVAVQLTDYAAWWPSVSPDGKMLAAWYFDEQANATKLAVIPFEGGRPIKIFDVGPDVDTGEVRWTMDGQALTYIVTRDDIGNIWSQPVAGGPPKQVTDFKADFMRRFEWSRDGKQLVCARGVENVDVVLIRDFR